MSDIDRPGQGSGQGPHGDEDAAAAGATAAGGHSRRSPWLLPLLTLLIGLAVGAGITALALGGNSEGSPIAEATPTATTPAPQPTTASPGTGDGVVIPATCLQIADEAQTLNRVLVEGVQAARDLDASALSGIVREFGGVQGRLTELAQDCRAGAGTPVPPTRSADESPAPATSVVPTGTAPADAASTR